jgi:hypothetical protein
MNEQDIEQAIQAKGLTAPRVTPAHIKALMDRIVYTFDVRPNGSTTTLAHAFLDGDFYLATGVSSCVSVENFDAELGKDIAIAGAKAAAEDKLWELEGYALRERLAAAPKAGDWLARLQAERHEVAERLAKLREFMAAPKGNPTPRQLALLAKQERAMSDYVWAMDDRIADAEAPE